MLNMPHFIFRTLLGCFVLAATAFAAVAAPPEISDVRVGIGGEYKLGRWTPVDVTIVTTDEPFAGQLEIIVPDGDGIDAVYTQAINLVAGQTHQVAALAKFGRAYSGVRVRLTSDETNVSASYSATSNPQAVGNVIPAAHPADDELFLQLGGDVGFDEIISRRSESAVGERSVCEVDSADQLPTQGQGYDGISQIIVTTGEASIIDEIRPEQWQAILKWVNSGGRLLISVGRRGDDLLKPGGPLEAFAPGRFLQTAPMPGSTGLETFTRAQQRLDVSAMRISVLRDITGRVYASEKVGGQEVAVVVGKPYGLGAITFVAIDLDHGPIADWKDRKTLIYKLALGNKNALSQADSKGAGRVIRVGYTDLAGQLRGAMEQFPGVIQVDFLWVAVIVGIYVLLIGPADYFFLKRVVGRMELTWITFPLIVIGVGVFTAAMLGVFRGSTIRSNNVEIIDLVYNADEDRPQVFGAYWASLYSPSGTSVDLSLEPPADNDAFTIDDVELAWHGLPGDSIAGMGARYSAAVQSSYTIADEGKLTGVPLQGGSTTNLFGRWSGLGPEANVGKLSARGDSITGVVRNPLATSLSDCVLFYNDRAYLFKEPLQPGGLFSVQQRISERSIEWRLARKKVDFTDADITTPWDPQSNDIERIMEIMMLHESAGGSAYTGLTADFQPWVDATEQLRLGKAVFIGRAETSFANLDGLPETDADDARQRYIWCRLILPVAPE